MSEIIGGTICYVDDKRKICIIYSPDIVATKDVGERRKIAIRLRAYVLRQRQHHQIDSIQQRKAMERIEHFERTGELPNAD